MATRYTDEFRRDAVRIATTSRRQKTITVQIPFRRAKGPLNLPVDSTGIKFMGDGEWLARKHGIPG